MTDRFNICRFFIMLAIAAGMTFVRPARADARVYGEAEVGYTNYQSKNFGERRDGSSLQHRYMLMYSRDGLLEYGRLGFYKYSLGYEWAAFNSEIESSAGKETYSDSTGHLLFNGILDIKPQRLPFRLRAYSRDMNRTGFLDDTATFLLSDDQIINPNIPTSLINGTHIASGATLTFGLKNDTFHPLYKELPLLTIDYTNNYDKDNKSLTPVNSRFDRLGIMLSKGDVEFSFWRREYKDRENPASDYLDDTFTLGTVSYREGRKYIDLTNWIKISADASFYRSREGAEQDTSDEYSVNLHGIASRDRWELMTFNNFSRTMSNAGPGHFMTVPVFARGVWNADTDWQLRFSATDSKTKGITVADNQKNTDLLASVRVDTLKRSQFTLSPSLSVEKVEEINKSTLIVAGNVETASTRRFSERYALYGAYNISVAQTDTGGDTSQYVQNTLSGRGVYRMTDQLRFELDQRFKVGSGRNETGSGILATNLNEQTYVPGTSGVREKTSNGYYQSITKFTTSWIPTPRMRVGFVLGEDILQQQGNDMDMLTTLTNTIEYSLPSFAVGSTIQLARRDYGEVASTEIRGSGSIAYTPDKTMSADIRYDVSHMTEDGSTSDTVDLSQRFRYSFFQASGYGRNWLNLREELSFVKWKYVTPGMTDRFDSKKRLTLGADYYPTRNVFLSAVIRYSLLDPGNAKELLGSAGIGVRFRKLQANLDYSYGTRNGDEDDRVEQRIFANVRKQF